MVIDELTLHLSGLVDRRVNDYVVITVNILPKPAVTRDGLGEVPPPPLTLVTLHHPISQVLHRYIFNDDIPPVFLLGHFIQWG